MAVYIEPATRNVIPRWRESHVATALGERGSIGSRPPFRPNERELEQRKAEWLTCKAPVYAVELIGTALAAGRPDEAKDAAEYLVALRDAVTPLVQKLANRVLENVFHPRADSTAGVISMLRRRVRLYPRTALSWMDLALAYATIGHLSKARRCVEAAVGLAPNDRFIVRSAVRFFLHVGEPDRAALTLLACQRTTADPWLVAADLAVSSVMSRSSELVKIARSMITDASFSHLDLSEVAGQLGTLYLADGRALQARKSLTVAARRPTDNSAAQITWLTSHRHIEIDTTRLQAPRPFEAKTWPLYFQGNWRAALDCCQEWQNDEPFASRPPVLGSHIAGSLLEDYKLAVSIAERGAKANPTDPVILNNLAFYHAQNGELERAEQVISRVSVSELRSPEKVAPLATQGLIAFRKGDAARGELLYKQAMEKAAGNPRLRLMADIHYALEQMRSGMADGTLRAKRILASSEGKNDPVLAVYRDRLDNLIQRSRV